MKRVVLAGPREIKFVDGPVPAAGPGEIVVKAAICGISTGTEMMLYRGNYPNFKHKKWPQWKDYPIYPGYELVGEVVAVGPDPAADGAGRRRRFFGTREWSADRQVCGILRGG